MAASLLVTGCSFTDVFSTGSDNDAPPRATATPTAAPSSDRTTRDSHSSDLRHRYVVSPPRGVYDPHITVASPAEQLLEEAAEQWSDTDTVHFDLNVDGTTYLDVNETIELDSVEGDLKRPDQAKADASIQIGFASFDVGLIIIGDDAYMTNFLTGNWERAPSDFAFKPALFFDEEHGIGGVLESMTDVELGDESTVGGTRVTEVTGIVDQQDISQLVGGSLEGEEISVTLWIDSGSGDLLQISLSEPDDVDGDPTTWIIAFSKHNDPVTIEEPEL